MTDYIPTRTVRVYADGSELLFLSEEKRYVWQRRIVDGGGVEQIPVSATNDLEAMGELGRMAFAEERRRHKGGDLYVPRVLNLTVHRKWFDLIASGIKKFEYRQGKKYWHRRLLDKHGYAIEFDEVHFRNGYRHDSPFCRVQWKGLGQWSGGGVDDHGEKFEAGDFSIVLGDVLEVRL